MRIARSGFSVVAVSCCVLAVIATSDFGSSSRLESRPLTPEPSAVEPPPVEEIRRAVLITDVRPPRYESYAGHVVKKGEHLADIAKEGGSSSAAIMTYNALSTEPAPGRVIIVPTLPGRSSALKSSPFIIEHGPAGSSRVALTLDAGSTAEPLPRVLEALQRRNLTITFFVTGYFVREHPEMVRRIAAAGHEFGNHSLSHPDLRHVDDRRLLREFVETERLLTATAGASTRPFFRPPYGAYNNHVLVTAQNLGFIPVYWTLDSLDSVGAKKNSDFLYKRVTSHLSSAELHGAIILMHVDSMGTAEAMPRILDRYAAMGLQVCKLSRLLNDG